ncbi:hypothetical protein LSCM1_03625 [Leishmania martiniquensis]|uniref:Uncharacterized protein n=1 Tax=Leishmania martiniquensis TaxID=1580590 RepID=A0A836H8W6_9TRYP|nr:hypothetical protein LSCM1_03625 [Leishmania martiniquensis]
MSQRLPRLGCAKRLREDATESCAHEMRATPIDHLLATPPRSTNGLASLIPSNPFVTPAQTSCSPSACTTAGTDGGLSEDSVFILDISNHSCSFRRRRACAAVPSEAEVNQWQQELNDFFTKLDEQPLRIVPR